MPSPSSGRRIYRALNGCDPADARIDTDRQVRRHVLASIIAVAAMEDGPVWHARLGLVGRRTSRALMARWFPHAIAPWHGRERRSARDDDEVDMVRDLLLANRTNADDESRWLAHMVARRAVEPSHLWEDLGLRNREELSRLLKRHFAPLAGRNTRDMRWKRFFYRMLCEDDGFLLCATPVCTDCATSRTVSETRTGESRLARTRRAGLANSAS